jgi:hypothetical protein
MWFVSRSNGRRNENEKRALRLAFSFFPYRLMNEFAKKIFVVFKIAVPKSNKHKSSILQVGLNSGFT